LAAYQAKLTWFAIEAKLNNAVVLPTAAAATAQGYSKQDAIDLTQQVAV
jgi:hypothetical protein